MPFSPCVRKEEKSWVSDLSFHLQIKDIRSGLSEQNQVTVKKKKKKNRAELKQPKVKNSVKLKASSLRSINLLKL
jgi:hypothetical protein